MATCEDYPCCGHEAGDCDGSLYGSDESIKQQVFWAMQNGHGDCEHEAGIYNCEGSYDEDECDDEEHECDACKLTPDGWVCSYCERPCPVGAHEEVTV